MAFTAFRGMNAFSQLLMALFVIMVSVMGVMVIAVLLAIPVLGFDRLIGVLSEANLYDEGSIMVLKYIQTVQSVGMFVLPPLLIGWLFEGDFRRYLSMDRPISGRMSALAVVGLVLAIPAIAFIGYLNQVISFPTWLAEVEGWMRGMEEQAEIVIERFMDVQTTGGLLFNLLMIAVIPAIGEEFLFRGVIQQIFTKMTRNYHWGIWISAFLFSALHLQFFGFVPRLLLGALFGYFLVYSGSIWVPVLVHFINNAMGVLAMYFGSEPKSQFEQLIDPDFSNGFLGYIPLVVISLMCSVAILWYMKSQSKSLDCVRGIE
ncbi:MAG: lysostaphin resistance A-like protein [Mangrovibacterium sp.]